MECKKVRQSEKKRERKKEMERERTSVRHKQRAWGKRQTHNSSSVCFYKSKQFLIIKTQS